jgi:hypothetical protein
MNQVQHPALRTHSAGVAHLDRGIERPHMSLLTAHKILIASAVALFVLYGGWELQNYANGDGSALLRSFLSVAAAVGLAIYLRWVWVHRPSETARK